MSVKVGVIGAGVMGRNHARVYSEIPNVELVGVADIFAGNANQTAQRYGGKSYTDYRQMLDEQRPQAVSVAVPTGDHLEVALEIAQRGIHLHIEKPIAFNVAEARQIIDWVRFYPIGKRALDGGNIDGEFCLLPMAEYIQHSNTERIVILQIESPEALENVEEICSLPGFDGILFGPGDFSHRIGKAGQLDAPEVVAARKRVAAATRQHGKFAMTAGLIAPLATLVEEGYRVINIGADVIALTGYVKQRLDLVRGLVAELPADVRPPVRSPYA